MQNRGGGVPVDCDRLALAFAIVASLPRTRPAKSQIVNVAKEKARKRIAPGPSLQT
jgi:hypothetical protein